MGIMTNSGKKVVSRDQVLEEDEKVRRSIPSTLFSLSLVSVANALATNGLIDLHSLLLVLISCLMKVPDGTHLCRSLGSASSPWRPRPSPSLLGGAPESEWSPIGT